MLLTYLLRQHQWSLLNRFHTAIVAPVEINGNKLDMGLPAIGLRLMEANQAMSI